MSKKKKGKMRAVYCSVCFAQPGDPCRNPDGKSRPPHKQRMAAVKSWEASNKHPRRTSGNTGTRLQRTRVVTPDIKAKQRRARRTRPVTVSFVCPLCGGPHSRAEHDWSHDLARDAITSDWRES
jgi:hypothetical protein